MGTALPCTISALFNTANIFYANQNSHIALIPISSYLHCTYGYHSCTNLIKSGAGCD